MPHYLGPNRKVNIVTRKVFEDFGQCGDQRAWEAACEERSNDSWMKVCVCERSSDPELEYLRQWLLRNGATEEDQYVILGISW